MTYVPVVYQEFHKGCKEIRVTVVGDRVFGTQFENEVIGDWHRSDRKKFNCVVHRLPSEIENACIKYLRKLDLVYGAFDFLLTEKGEYIFLELNSYGDWRWIENITKQPITQTIIDYCKSILSNKNIEAVK
jgi:glutathione synthase/RimK-type ligase-like ATP-grasp enzyme